MTPKCAAATAITICMSSVALRATLRCYEASSTGNDGLDPPRRQRIEFGFQERSSRYGSIGPKELAQHAAVYAIAIALQVDDAIRRARRVRPHRAMARR